MVFRASRISVVAGLLLMPALAVLFVTSCANPVAPSGGPPDETPPQIVSMTPEAEAVNVTARSVRITFSEYVDAGSFSQAFSMTPEMTGRLDFDWKRRSVEIRFPEPLRDSTTYILTLDTNLRDAHSVALKEPITLAFSTGPEINRGRIEGLVIEPMAGQPAPGLDVYAYEASGNAAPDSLPERPAYRTQTDDQGRFRFDYLREQPYFVVAVADRNRNRRPDPLERFAVPPRPTIPALEADSMGSSADSLHWITTLLDTIPPELRRVQVLSRSRLQARFSDPVRLTARDPSAWTLRDSLQDAAVTVRSVYTLPDDPRVVLLQTDLLAERPHLLAAPLSVVDSSGMPVTDDPVSFIPSADDDTLQMRFRAFLPADARTNEAGQHLLLPSMQPGVRFNQSLDEDALQARIVVTDTLETPLAFSATTDDGTAYALHLDPPLQPRQIVEVRVEQRRAAGTDTVYTRVFQRIPDADLGSLSGFVASRDTAGPIVLELFPPDDLARTRPYRMEAQPDGSYQFIGLPDGVYFLRAFVDRNNDRRWTGGRILPYVPAEPVTWLSDSLNVRPRWDTAREDTLWIPSFGL